MAMFTVTNLNDSGAGSLRQAILDANATAGADTITFEGSTFTDATPDTITLASGALVITDDLEIQGLGADMLTVDAAQNSRVFIVNDNDNSLDQTITLSGLRITGGNAGSFEFGGGILNREILNLRDSIVSNSTGFNGGGIGNSSGTMTITGSIIRDNAAIGNSGGGIASVGSSLIITNSIVSGNSANSAGRVGGGISLIGGTTSIMNTTISDNVAAGNGGGIFTASSLTIGDSSLTITNSTISGNTSTSGNGGGIANESTLALTNSTVSDNEATSGGGVANSITGIATLESTIVADNTAPTSNPDLLNSGGTVNATNSLIENDANQINGTNANVITGLDPLLDPAGLQNNGGPTETIALQPNSPAIDTGSNPNGLTTDQRGDGFERVSGSAADMGAFEVQSDVVPLVFGEPATIFVDDEGIIQGNAFGAGDPYMGDLFSNTDGTANPDDAILGMPGDDTIWPGETGNDLIDAGEGNNTIGIGTGDSRVAAGAGDDFIYSLAGGGGTNLIDLGDGNNEAYLEAGDNDITTGAGNDLIGIGSGNDTVNAGDGDDFVYSINGGGGTNSLDLGDGANQVYVENGDYDIVTGMDADEIGLGTGNDTVNAGDGNNLIYLVDTVDPATVGNKDILTGLGDDYVQTGGGNDQIDAGLGLNTLFGGAGADIFTARTGAYNFIGDFEIGIDQIELADFAFGDLSFFQGTGDVSADVFGFVGGEAVLQVANTTVAALDNTANFV